MTSKKIFNFIKTECGQAKYEKLLLNKTFFGRLRLYWFIVFASIRDFNLNN
tara:strand:+ start:3019 stop:3171 length:153 start_codon:yes stop_codon:yes gene_type:complete